MPGNAEELFQRDARLTDAVGQLTLKTADKPKQLISINEETPLTTGDILETSTGSRAEVTIEGEMVFELEPGSKLKIKNLSSENTQLELLQGALLSKVKPMTEPGQSLTIKMPTAVVAIRGTEFGAQTGNGVSHVGVFDEGHVDVSGAWGREHVMLAPQQETKVTLSAVPQAPHKLNHFLAYRNQMPHVRNRAAYWRKNWRPQGAWQRQSVRARLFNPNRPKSIGFRRPSAPQAVQRAVPTHRLRHKRKRNLPR
jgi:hypothetical protein